MFHTKCLDFVHYLLLFFIHLDFYLYRFQALPLSHHR